jgi:hypothetical protein
MTFFLIAKNYVAYFQSVKKFEFHFFGEGLIL